jgi:hypothetical protein
MSQNQEIIEAKLCAFIDGELDAEVRVEIEKHLEANPQHRRLLESLKATRDLIKWLPREAAPPEVAETLNGQLERSVLLDSDGDFLRPSIWPRILAAAAIVALTAGLGLAVYYTLPKSQKSATPYAFHNGEGPGSTGSESPGGEADRSEEYPARRAAGARAMMSKSGSLDAGKALGKVASTQGETNELERWATQVRDNREAIAAVANGSANAANIAPAVGPQSAANSAVVMLVRSNAPQDTRRQVTSFLDAQRIQWKEASALAQNELGQPPRPQPPQQQAQQTQQPVQQLQQQPQQKQQQLQRQPSVGQAQGSIQQTAENQAFGGSRNQAEALASQATMLAANSGIDGSGAGDSTTRPAEGSLGAALAMMNRSQAEHGMYVARMSRRQAVTLGNAIAQEPAQSTELKDMAGTTMTLNELGSGKPAGANGFAYNGPPATEQSPQAGGGNAAGGFGGGRLGGGFGGGFGAGAGRAGIATTDPATQPADSQPARNEAQTNIFLATQPAVQALQAAGIVASQQGDEALDVVIVVEAGLDNAAGGAPASLPASRPVDAAASQPAPGR